MSCTVLQRLGVLLCMLCCLDCSSSPIAPTALFVAESTGDAVLDLPSHVTRIQVTASTTARCANFVVRIGGRLVVNTILGTCLPARAGSTFEGTYQVGTNRIVEIFGTAGLVAWTVREVR